MKEVFISRKMNRWGRRFGFVGLFDVQNVCGLEREMDQAWVGKMKLYVNVSRYIRAEVVRPQGPPRGKETQTIEERNCDGHKRREGNSNEDGRRDEER